MAQISINCLEVGDRFLLPGTKDCICKVVGFHYVNGFRRVRYEFTRIDDTLCDGFYVERI